MFTIKLLLFRNKHNTFTVVTFMFFKYFVCNMDVLNFIYNVNRDHILIVTERIKIK